jgi:hypothetical protein
MSVNIKNAHIKNLHIGPGIITDGLVSWWNAASVRSYPRSGSIWYDLIKKNQNDGSLVNMSETNFSEEDGGVLVFDGSNEYVSVAHDTSLNFGVNSFSVSMWIKLTQNLGLGSLGSYIIGKRGLGTLGSYKGWQIKAINKFGDGWDLLDSGIDDGTRSDTTGTDTLQQFNRWYMVTMVYDSGASVVGLWIDKTRISVKNFVTTGDIDNTLPVEIFGTRYSDGAHYASPVQTTDGSIANVSIYTKALSADEVAHNYSVAESIYNN